MAATSFRKFDEYSAILVYRGRQELDPLGIGGVRYSNHNLRQARRSDHCNLDIQGQSNGTPESQEIPIYEDNSSFIGGKRWDSSDVRYGVSDYSHFLFSFVHGLLLHVIGNQ